MRKILALVLVLLICGCAIRGGEHRIKLDCGVTPSRVSLSDRETLKIEVKVTNIGKEKEAVRVEVTETQGLRIIEQGEKNFMLKPDESRIITFPAELSEDAIPGDYVIDVRVTTQSGDVLVDRAKVRVVEKKGLL